MDLDERDQTILKERATAYDAITGPRVGDWIIFADGVSRRISYVWPDGPQTSDGGSYYLGNGHVSMSGSLYPHVPMETLTPTAEKRDGRVWFFHHDHHTAHNGVEAVMSFRVWNCSEKAVR